MKRITRWLLGCWLLAGLLPVQAGTLVQFRTLQGDLDVELFDQDKPATVDNFLRYVKSGLYQNTYFHRCLPGFIAQGGGFYHTNRTQYALFTYYFTVPKVWGAITNEYNVGRKFSNTCGTIAMAKVGGNPNSATSEWFFNLTNNAANLDNQNGGFTVFGRVVGRTNLLDWFNRLQTGGGGIINLDNNLFMNLPVAYLGMTPPFFSDLIYVDITLLLVQVKLNADRSREISWNSVDNRLNRVEFTTQFPPVWQTLDTLPGSGERMQVTDTSASAAKRFYRVRVDY